MTREEHTQKIRDIRASLTDEGKVTELLAGLSEDYGMILTESEKHALKANELTTANADLRDQNMRLFLKVGTPVPKEPNENKNTDKPVLTYEALFEKGRLK